MVGAARVAGGEDLPVSGGPVAVSGPGTKLQDLFVGRGFERAELTAGLEAAVDGRGRVVLIAGEAGIGKSRLADEVASGATGRGAVTLWGRCWEAGGAPAYWPWTQVLRDAVRRWDGREPAEQPMTGMSRGLFGV